MNTQTNQPLGLDDADLGLLAYDIADVMDRGEYGLGEIADCHLLPFLAEFLGKALAYARAQAAAEASPATPRNQAGEFVHTCNGSNRAGLGFGRRAEPGECARCDELRDGAEARPRFAGKGDW
jgi:hypothetical protein